ncbi:MAG: hypothetical protein A3F72_10085 [Bacteroidetes bacterium RIFCSPLOWO2_12_FULL_35_15]|nr:MAG: hypothetical protein A3F72_10085 [Bacteroidetes bacterium RIFCSPLOWO2_12_FULL_35_15]
MKTKEKRQKLELALIKSIEEILIKEDSEAAKTIRKITYEAAKRLAKKFYKTVKTVQAKTKAVKKVSTAPPKKLIIRRNKANIKLTSRVAKKPVRTVVLKTRNKK